MPKFPEPPPVEVLRRLEPRLHTIPAGVELWRISMRAGRHPNIDIAGLWYASSMYANRPIVALFERAQNALAATPLVYRPLVDPALRADLTAIAHTLRYKLVP